MNFNPNTKLKRAIDFEIKIDSVQSIEIKKNNESQKFSNHALVILDIFTQPTTTADALKKLQIIGFEDWIQLTSTISKLWNFGILYNQSEKQIVSDKNKSSFGSAPIHIAMLNDRARTDLFINALNKTVKEGDVVIDIGTGTGVLAIAAARAGAKKVYAIESGAMADVAQAVIDKTEVAHKIELVRGWSTKIEIPEKADVLVSEIIGNDPFGEKILQTFKDAHERLLKPDVRILPASMKVFGLPCVIPSSVLKNRLLNEDDLINWKKWYKIDFSPLKKLGQNNLEPLLMASNRVVKKLDFFKESLLLTEVDFHDFKELKIENVIPSKSEKGFNGLLVYFELELADNVLSTHPDIADETNSWKTPIWYLPEAEKLSDGSSYTIQYSYTGGKDSTIDLIID